MKAAVAALAIAIAAPPAVGAAAPKRVAVDWTRTVAPTPQGGFRMGNPQARVKLVEYGSLACPHCRHFEETGYTPLVQKYVRTGKVSYEFRNFLLNAPDIAVSMLAHCAGPGKFYPMSQAVFASQPEWFAKLGAITESQNSEMEGMTIHQRVIRLSEIAGFAQIAGRFGVTPARSRQCLADPKGMEKLLAMTKAAEDRGITRTPTFLINGKVTDAATWDQLEPLLK